MIESVHKGNNSELIAKAASLWFRPGELVCDVTYGKGNWWLWVDPPPDFVLSIHDLVTDGVDFRHLPEANESIDTVIFDPPYVSAGGRLTSTIPEFNKAYGLTGAPRTPAGVDRLITQGMAEAVRVLKGKSRGYEGGRLWVKNMDYISSATFHQGHRHVLNTADVLGLTQIDEFVLWSGTGPQPLKNLDGTVRRQVHARSAHSFLSIFQKEK